jgi:hypothetical protein
MRARKYVQSHTVDTPLNEGMRNSSGMLPEYDGVAVEMAFYAGMSSAPFGKCQE